MNFIFILLLLNIRNSYCKIGLVKTLMSGNANPHVDKNVVCEKTTLMPDGPIDKARC